MTDSALPKHRRLGRLATAACLLALLSLLGWLLLPRGVETLALPPLFEAAGIRSYDAPVRRIGLTGLDAGPLRIGPVSDPGITVVSLAVAYTPPGLLGGSVEGVVLEGVEVVLRKDAEGGWSIPGLPEAAPTTGKPQSAPPALPVGRIEIRGGVLRLETGVGRHRIPFSATMEPAPDGNGIQGRLSADLGGAPVTAQVMADFERNAFSARWTGEGLRLRDLADLVGVEAVDGAAGRAGIAGEAEGRLAPLGLASMGFEWRQSPCRLDLGGERLYLSGADPEDDLRLRAGTTDGASWEIRSSAVTAAVSGIRAAGTVSGTLRIRDGGLAWKGTLAMEGDIGTAGGAGPSTRLGYRFDGDGSLSAGTGFQAELRGVPAEGAERIRAGMGAYGADLAAPVISIAAAGSADRGWFHLHAETAGGQFRDGDGRGTIGPVDGDARFEWTEEGRVGHISVHGGPVDWRGDGVRAGLRRLRAEGEAEGGPSGTLSGTGTVFLEGGTASLPGAGVRLDGIEAQVPLQWPPPERGKAGRLTVASMTWEGRALGAAHLRLHQAGEDMAFRISHENRLIPGLKLSGGGRAGLGREAQGPFASLEWEAARSGEAPPVSLADLTPGAPGVPAFLKGAFRAGGAAALRNGVFSASLQADLENGRLTVDEPALAVDGLRASVLFPDVGVPRTAPAQRLSFDAMSFGTVRTGKGRMAFQIEPGSVFFLESARVDWCGGALRMPAARFRPGVKDHELTVYCDRLKLDQLLEQLALAKAEGGGALSGLVPVRLTEKGVQFEDAFLYSTPGEGGVIRVQGSEALTMGIPPGTPQYHQMELARYALKDYDYRWAKLILNTVEDDLLLQLQFDGKPAGPLPFVYRPEAGGFVKTGPDDPGSVFQGIRLDVNFRLPFNRMLRYRELIQQLLD
jgi:hypothetical protein